MSIWSSATIEITQPNNIKGYRGVSISKAVEEYKNNPNLTDEVTYSIRSVEFGATKTSTLNVNVCADGSWAFEYLTGLMKHIKTKIGNRGTVSADINIRAWVYGDGSV